VDKNRINEFVGDTALTVVDVMERIDKNSKGILFIVDENEMLFGCVTDGDIRRWIIRTGNLNASVLDVMNKKPKYLYIEKKGIARDVMIEKRITAIPILDKTMRISDIVLLNEECSALEEKKKGDLSFVPVVVMAGGKGTRLYPYTKILPKPLIPIGETPIVERIIDCFVQYGIEKFYMTVNYKKNMIRSYFSELLPQYKIEYIEEEQPLGTGGSIKLINENFENPLFVTNCDALILADYADIYDYHIRSGNSITIVSALKNITVPYGVLYSGENGELKEMEEKPRLSYFINTGMYIINPEIIGLIPDNVMFHMTHLVEKVMLQGGKVGTYPISEDSFLDMGEITEMKRMEQKLNIISEK